MWNGQCDMGQCDMGQCDVVVILDGVIWCVVRFE